MTATIKQTISMPRALWEQAERAAQQLNIPSDQLMELALERFIKETEGPGQSPEPAVNEPFVLFQPVRLPR